MPVDIERVLREGIGRTLARNGLAFAGILYVIGVLNGVFASSLLRGLMPAVGADSFGTMPNAPAIGMSPALAGIVAVVLWLASTVVTIGAIRTFVTEETARIPSEHVSRNLVLTILNLVVGGIAFGVVVGVGFLLLVVPGLFLLVSLFFWSPSVIVEDHHFVAGLRHSWGLTRGHRWRLLAVGLAVVIAGAVVNVAFGLPGLLLPRSVAFLVGQIGSALVTTFILATTARTYVHLLELEDATAAAPAPSAGG